jgi:hypothetical protein
MGTALLRLTLIESWCILRKVSLLHVTETFCVPWFTALDLNFFATKNFIREYKDNVQDFPKESSTARKYRKSQTRVCQSHQPKLS